MPWQPIIDDARTDVVLQEISAECVVIARSSTSSSDLGNFALLFATLFSVDGDEGWLARAVECLNKAASILERRGQGASGLFGGLAGIGWNANRVSGIVLAHTHGSAKDELDSIDIALWNKLHVQKWSAPYDLVSGLIGVGVYFLSRTESPLRVQALTRVLDHLDDLAVPHSGATTWFTTPPLIPPDQRESYPRGYYNLGVAHGVPGVVGFLGRVYQAGIEPERSKRLANAAMAWLQAIERSARADTHFGSWYLDGEQQTNSRLAWCYGDLGLAAVVFNAARRLSSDKYEEWALRIITDCAERAGLDGVRDSGLCHGAVGVAHLFGGLYQATHNRALLKAARHWYDRALALREPGLGTVGFFHYRLDREQPKDPDHSFLTGVVGIALALITATHGVEPTWNELLAL